MSGTYFSLVFKAFKHGLDIFLNDFLQSTDNQLVKKSPNKQIYKFFTCSFVGLSRYSWGKSFSSTFRLSVTFPLVSNNVRLFYVNFHQFLVPNRTALTRTQLYGKTDCEICFLTTLTFVIICNIWLSNTLL